MMHRLMLMVPIVVAMVLCAPAASRAQAVKNYVAGSPLASPDAIAIDVSGNVYVANYDLGTISKVVSGGVTSTFASGFHHPAGLAFDAGGTLYVSDSGTISKVTTGGSVSTYFAPTDAAHTPQGPIAVDQSGNLYAVPPVGTNATIEKVTPNGAVIMIGGQMAAAARGIAVDLSGNIYVAGGPISEVANHAVGGITKITPQGAMSAFAAGIFTNYSVGPAPSPPVTITADSAGNLYVYTNYLYATGGAAIVKLTVAGTLSQVYPTPTLGLANAALALDNRNTLYVADPAGNAIDTIDVTPSPLLAAVLPGSRSVQLGARATIFATVLNTGDVAVNNCMFSLGGNAPVGLTMDYQVTDKSTNRAIGSPDQPVTIAANDSQTFVLAFNASVPLSVSPQILVAACDGVNPAPVTVGVNTAELSFSAAPVSDIIVLSATASADGIVNVPLSAGVDGAFALASINVGLGGALTVFTDTGGAILPMTALICQSNPTDGSCLSTPSTSVPINFVAGATPTFSVFVKATGAIAFDPAETRIFVRFRDSNGIPSGSTSVAVRTQ